MTLLSLQAIWRFLFLATFGQVLFGLGAHFGYHRGYQQGLDSANPDFELNSAQSGVDAVKVNVTLNLDSTAPTEDLEQPIKVTDVLVVAAHYQEDVMWLQKVTPYKHVVYTHREMTVRKENSNLKGTHRVPNKGREASAYLKYIVDSYSNLPPIIAFIHGHRSSWHHKDMADTLQYVGNAPRWTYMSLNDATKGGGGFKKGWRTSNVTFQTQRLACYVE
eukprot:CAMPEP_0118955596 /NCGR_PEP_ID=MMETSP1169-20130426/60240_1 /TAXON_ID=36882 /ORGANISM="Pyramimonas obovata, Strain CCMP722" /LENGTH=218 /DNA_ID=CAMNT_0006903481 /DNA_START=92 /DNA_END=745 /DNA_ORIENTATION=-